MSQILTSELARELGWNSSQEDHKLKTRILHCLIHASFYNSGLEDIVNIQQLAQRTDEELLSLPNFGKKCLKLVRRQVPNPEKPQVTFWHANFYSKPIVMARGSDGIAWIV